MAVRSGEVAQLLLQVDASVALAQRNLSSLRNQVANDTATMEGSLTRLERATGGIGAGFGKLSGGANSLLGFFGIGAISIGTFGAALVSAAKDAEDHAQALRLLGAVLDATGNKTGLTRAELEKTSAALETSLAIPQEEIIKAQTVLAQFDGVAGSTFTHATKLAADMAAVFGGDLAGNTEQLGQALQNLATGHIEGVTRGFKFLGTEVLNNITTLAQHGKAVEAQDALLAALEKRVGGAGEAKAAGLAGAFFRLKDAIGDATREMLNQTGILPAFIRGLNALADTISGGPEKSFSQLASEAGLNAARARQQLDRVRQQGGSGHTGFYSSSSEIDRLEKAVAFWSRKADEYIAASRQDIAEQQRTQKVAADAAKDAQAEAKKNAAANAAKGVAKIAPGDEITAERRTDMLRDAQRYIGLKEGDSALRALFSEAGVAVDPKMTAWCAAFVNAVLATQGLPGTGSLAARSFLNYGSATNTPDKGDIVVLRRGTNAGEGHVGFFSGFDPKGNVQVTGGNQGNAVSTASFPRKDVLAFRRAPDISQIEAALPDLDKLRDDALAIADVDPFAEWDTGKPLVEITKMAQEAGGLSAIIANMPDVSKIVPTEVQERFETLKQDAAQLAEDVLRAGFGFEHMTVGDVVSRLKEMIVQLLVIEPIVSSIRDAMKNWQFGSGAASGGTGGSILGLFQSIGSLFGGGSRITAGGSALDAQLGASAAAFTPFGGHRAAGGPVSPGTAYVVGEKRPELFVPRTPGVILPQLGGRGGGDVYNVHVDAKDTVLADTVKGWVVDGIRTASQAGAIGGAQLARTQFAERQRRNLGRRISM
jgi:uncharacterized protein (TIGR02594 family)